MRRDALNSGTSPTARFRSSQGLSLEKSRRAKRRRVALEALESRTLLAASLPAAVVSPLTDPVIATGPGGSNQSSPNIAINPSNPNDMVAVWTETGDPAGGINGSTTVFVKGAFTTNSGATWSAFTPVTTQTDFTSSATSLISWSSITDGTVAFERGTNDFYVLASEHNAAGAGELVLAKYALSSGTPVSITPNPNSFNNSGNQEDIYTFNANQVLKPVIAVDNNVATFSDSFTNANGTKVTLTQTDPDVTGGSVGNADDPVYVTWATADTNSNPGIGNFAPNKIEMMASSDGAASFSAPVNVDTNTAGNTGATNPPAADTSPQVVVSQGTATAAGGTATVTGGTVDVAWSDFGTGSSATPKVDNIMFAGLSSGQDFDFVTPNSGPALGQIGSAFVNAASVTVPVTTLFPITVPNTANFKVTGLNVKLGNNHPSMPD